MATGTVSRLDAIARDVYGMGTQIMKQFNEGKPLLDLIESTEKVPFMGKVEGRRVLIPTHTAAPSNTAVGVSEEGGLPEGDVSELDKLTFTVASHWQTLKYSGLAEDTQGGGDQSVENWLPSEMRRHQASALRKIGWLLHRDGSGMVGQLATAGNSGSTLRFASGTDIDILKAATSNGDQLVLRNLTTGALNSGQTTSKALVVLTKTGSRGSTPQITVQHEDSTSYTASAADLSAFGAYWYDSQGSSLIGIEAYCSDSNPGTWGSSTSYLGGIDRSAAGNEWWKGYRFDGQIGLGANQVIDVVSHIQPVLDYINSIAGDELGSNDQLLGVCRYGNWRAIGNQLSKDQRTAAPTKKVTGGNGREYKAVTYENVAFVLDRDAPVSKVRIFNPKKMRRYVMKPWGWNSKTGAIWERAAASDGRDADMYKGRLYCRQQMVALSCLCNAEIYNLSASS